MPRKKRKTSTKKSSKILPYLGGITLVLFFTSALVYTIFKWRINRVPQKNYNRYNSLVYDIPAEKLYIYLDDTNGTKRVISLPDTIKIPLAYGYGSYRVSVVDDLGRQEKFNEQLLSKSVELWLGIDIHSAFILDRPLNELNYFSINLETSNLSQIEKMWWLETYKDFTKNVPETALDQSAYLEKVDDNLVLRMLQRQELSKDLLFSETIASENLQLAIINTTPTAGLASNLSANLIGLGYDVAVVSDSSVREAKTQIIVDNSSSMSDDYFLPLSSFLEYPKNSIIYKDNLLSEYRAEVVILLGDDFNLVVNGE